MTVRRDASFPSLCRSTGFFCTTLQTEQQFFWLLSPPVLPLGGKLIYLVVETVMRLLIMGSHFSAGQTKCIQRHTVGSPSVWSLEPFGPHQRLCTSSSSGFQLLYLQLRGQVGAVEGDGRHHHILQLRWLPNLKYTISPLKQEKDSLKLLSWHNAAFPIRIVKIAFAVAIIRCSRPVLRSLI